MGAWVAVVGVVAGTAALGGQESATREPSPAISVAPPSPEAPANLAADGARRAGQLVVAQPGRSDMLITSEDLVVRGSATADVDRIAIILESVGGDASSPKALSMTDVTPGPGFNVTLAIPVQRGRTPLNVRVVAYDAAGIPVDVIGRRVIIGPRTPRTIGGDGLVGGIVFDSSWEDRVGGP